MELFTFKANIWGCAVYAEVLYSPEIRVFVITDDYSVFTTSAKQETVLTTSLRYIPLLKRFLKVLINCECAT